MKLYIFDMDGTLTESRQPINKQMSELLYKLQENNEITIITGGTIELIKEQILDHVCFRRSIHLLPTSGLSYYTCKTKIGIEHLKKLVYTEQMPKQTKQKIIKEIQKLIKKENITPLTNDQIEDRGTQITFSALGRSAPLKEKKEYDPNRKKRTKWKKTLKKTLPEINIVIGGTTSLDFTMKGKDKAYGIKKFLQHIKKPTKIYFFGDKLQKDGNDHPVTKIKQIKCIKVKNPNDCYNKIREELKCTIES